MPYARRLATLLAILLLPLLATPSAALARRGRTIHLKVPRFEVPPRSDLEICTFLRLPGGKPIDNAETLIVNLGGNDEFTSHHFLMWQYLGTDIDAFPAKGTITPGEACIDFGPGDTNQRALIAGSQSPRALSKLPQGLAQRLEPTTPNGGKPVIGLILNTHWINSSDRPQHAAVKITMRPVKRGAIKRYIKPLFEVVANAFIKVAPNTTDETGFAWAPGGIDFGGAFGGGSVPTGPACVAMVTAHMHKRGKLFEVAFHDGVNPDRMLYSTTDYSDPGQLIFDGRAGRPAPLLVRPGQSLRYGCTHDNGVTTAVKLGCEEDAGVAPGFAILELIQQQRGELEHAAKRCTTDADCPATDPAYPKRTFTGRCVPANLVFGFTSDDDMCILPGAYYDANVDAPPGQECDLDLLPAVN